MSQGIVNMLLLHGASRVRNSTLDLFLESMTSINMDKVNDCDCVGDTDIRKKWQEHYIRFNDNDNDSEFILLT